MLTKIGEEILEAIYKVVAEGAVLRVHSFGVDIDSFTKKYDFCYGEKNCCGIGAYLYGKTSRTGKFDAQELKLLSGQPYSYFSGFFIGFDNKELNSDVYENEDIEIFNVGYQDSITIRSILEEKGIKIHGTYGTYSKKMSGSS